MQDGQLDPSLERLGWAPPWYRMVIIYSHNFSCAESSTGTDLCPWPWACELRVSLCPRGGEGTFPISRLSQLLSRLFQLHGVVELPAFILLIAPRVR